MTSHMLDSFHTMRVRHLAARRRRGGVPWLEHEAHSNAIHEYQGDMLDQMVLSEQSSEVSLTLIEQQPEIRLNMRPLLLNFLMDVVISFRLSHQTFLLAINIIDRYSSLRIVKKLHYQLLGLSALWISSKALDPRHHVPLLDALRGICAYAYEFDLFKEMEKHIYKSLDWAVTKPTFIDFMDLYLNILVSDDSDQITAMIVQENISPIVSLATYLGELLHFFPEIYFDLSPLQLSVATILLSISLLRIPLNLLSLMCYFNTIQTGASSDPHSSASTHMSISSFQTVSNDVFYRKLLEMLDSPPKSLGRRYFESPTAPESFTQFPSWLNLAKDSLEILLSQPVATLVPCTPPTDSAAHCMDLRCSTLTSLDSPNWAPVWTSSVSGVPCPLTPQSGLASPYGRTEFDSFSCSFAAFKLEHPTYLPYGNRHFYPQCVSAHHHIPPRSISSLSPSTPGHLRKRSYDVMVNLSVTRSKSRPHPRR